MDWGSIVEQGGPIAVVVVVQAMGIFFLVRSILKNHTLQMKQRAIDIATMLSQRDKEMELIVNHQDSTIKTLIAAFDATQHELRLSINAQTSAIQDLAKQSETSVKVLRHIGKRLVELEKDVQELKIDSRTRQKAR